jgi:hypothetical protein
VVARGSPAEAMRFSVESQLVHWVQRTLQSY